jgi:hypothetical protein
VTSGRRYDAVQVTSTNGGARGRDLTHSTPKPASPVQLVLASSDYTARVDVRTRRPKASRARPSLIGELQLWQTTDVSRQEWYVVVPSNPTCQ